MSKAFSCYAEGCTQAHAQVWSYCLPLIVCHWWTDGECMMDRRLMASTKMPDSCKLCVFEKAHQFAKALETYRLCRQQPWRTMASKDHHASSPIHHTLLSQGASGFRHKHPLVPYENGLALGSPLWWQRSGLRNTRHEVKTPKLVASGSKAT
jgi:hypothetical protein